MGRRVSAVLIIGWAGVLIAGPSVIRGEPQQPDTPSPKAIEAMKLLDAPDPYQQQLGFLRLEALREPSTAETIKKYLQSPNEDMRSYSVRALAAIEGVAAVPVLLEQLKSDRTPRVRRAALLGLEPFQEADPRILSAFIKALRDRSPEVRMSAVDVVSRIDDPRAREAIFTRNQRERDRDVRRVLAMAIKRIGK